MINNMKKEQQTIAIYGGAFDPVHLGHLRCAENLQKHFNFTKFFFVPCKTPLLKNPAMASTEDRVRMLELAIHGKPEFEIDLREVRRESPSYMVDTLKSFNLEYPRASLTLIMGTDAFQKLPQWHQWQQLLDYCHILIMDRADIKESPLSNELVKLLEAQQVFTVGEFLQKKQGNIMSVAAGSYPISSTEIRNRLRKGASVSDWLAAPVLSYIKQNKLYL